MPNMMQVAFRFPEELVRRIDAYAEVLARSMPAGVGAGTATRADAVRALLEKALASEGLKREYVIDVRKDDWIQRLRARNVAEGKARATRRKKAPAPGGRELGAKGAGRGGRR